MNLRTLKTVTIMSNVESEDGESISGYISEVSDLKKSRSNIDYFHVVLQEKDLFNRVVLYSPEKKRTLEAFAEAKSPVKLSPIKRRKRSQLRDYDDEITLCSSFSITHEKVEYDYKPFHNSNSNSTVPITISQVIGCNDRETVTVVAYLHDVENQPTIPVLLPYRTDPLPKKEVAINDSTGALKFTLWGDLISAAKTSGTYTVSNAVLNKYKGESCLTSNSSTTIIPSKEDIEPTRDLPFKLVTSSCQFPPEKVHQIVRKSFCSTCKMYTSNDSPNSNLHYCHGCRSTVIASRTKHKIQTKLVFTVDGAPKTIFVPPAQFQLYFEQRKIPLPKDDSDVSAIILNDSKTKICYDSRGLCTGFL